MNRLWKTCAVGVMGMGMIGLLSVGAQARQTVAPRKDTSTTTVSTPPAWSKLQAAYDDDAKKPVKVKEEPKSSDTAYVVHLQVEGPDGKQMPGVFMRPKAPGAYPVVLLLHGLTSDKETMLALFGKPMIGQGVAVLAMDAPLHGERKDPKINPGQPTVFPTVIQQGVREWRRAIDYLATRKDVDMKHVGLLGYSMGSMMGSILGGVDNRIGALSLCVGGDPLLPLIGQIPEGFRDFVYAVSPSLYIGHVAPRPILMLNGKQDTTMPAEASKRLFAAAKEPKEQLWYDCGHFLTTEAGIKAVTWVLEKVKPGAVIKLKESDLPKR